MHAAIKEFDKCDNHIPGYRIHIPYPFLHTQAPIPSDAKRAPGANEVVSALRGPPDQKAEKLKEFQKQTTAGAFWG